MDRMWQMLWLIRNNQQTLSQNPNTISGSVLKRYGKKSIAEMESVERYVNGFGSDYRNIIFGYLFVVVQKSSATAKVDYERINEKRRRRRWNRGRDIVVSLGSESAGCWLEATHWRSWSAEHAVDAVRLMLACKLHNVQTTTHHKPSIAALSSPSSWDQMIHTRLGPVR